MNPVQMAAYTKSKYGKMLCADCAYKMKNQSRRRKMILTNENYFSKGSVIKVCRCISIQDV